MTTNYLQTQLPSDIFNSSNGDIKNFNGRAVKITNPGNGTRDLEDLGDWSSYQQQQQAQQLQQQTKAQEDAFMSSLDQIPTALSALRDQIGLPDAEQTYIQAGNTARNVANQVSNIAPTQQTIAKQVGISAPRLQQRIGAQTAKLQPAIDSANQGLDAAQSALSGLLGEYATGSQNIITPYQIKAGFLGDSIKNAFDIYNANLTANTSRAIAELQEKGLNDRAALDRAEQAAEAEQKASQGSFQDLGDKIALIDPTTGNIITSFPKGLSPSSASSGNVTPTLNTLGSAYISPGTSQSSGFDWATYGL